MQQPAHREPAPQPIPVREYRMGSTLRRAPIWFAGGLSACGALVVFTGLRFSMDEADVAAIAILLTVCSLVTLTLIIPAMRYRLRIDRRGIAVRWLWRWRIWPWEIFRSGCLHKDRSIGDFVLRRVKAKSRKKKLRRASLSLEYLDETDLTEVLAIVDRFWVPPPPPQVPERLVFRHGRVLKARKVMMDRIGIEVAGKRTPWSAVERIILKRATHRHADFCEVTLQLPGRMLRLVNDSDDEMTFKGVDPEVLAEALRLWAGDRLLIVTTADKPATEQEREFRIRLRMRTISLMRAILWGIPIIFFVAPILYVVPLLVGARSSDAFIILLASGAVLVLFCQLSGWFLRRSAISWKQTLVSGLQELERQRPGLTQPASEPTKD